ncbi:MAG: phosphate starvation-inducible protein PhoH, partial [Alistipes sp.]|nr:phosphate starvation-inducible protein PhoH [Alistipes sp.]
MTEAINKEISIDGVDPRELYGVQNAYLEQIRDMHPKLKIVARGSTLKVLGSKSEVGRFEHRMQGLIDYYAKYGHISSEVVTQCFAGVAPADDAPVDKDVIVYGNNGAVIRARTENQL